MPAVSTSSSRHPGPTSISMPTWSPASSSAVVATSAIRAAAGPALEHPRAQLIAAQGEPGAAGAGLRCRRRSRVTGLVRVSSAWVVGGSSPVRGRPCGVEVRRHRAGVDWGRGCRQRCSRRGRRAPRPSGRRSIPRSVRDSPSTGRPSRAASPSAIICGTSTPTYGARSVLFTTSRSARPMPGPTLARDVAAAGHVEHEDLRVDQRRREGRGQVVAAGLDENDVQRGEVALEVLDGQQVGGDVVADGGVRAGAGLDRADPLRVEDAGGAQEPGVLVGVDVVGDHAELQLGRRAPGRSSRSASSCRCRPGRRRRGAATASGRGGAVSACGSQARNNLWVVVAWISAHSSMSGAARAGISFGHGQMARARTASASICGCAASTQRGGADRVDRLDLQHGGGDGGDVVVPDQPDQLAGVQPGDRGGDAQDDGPARRRHGRCSAAISGRVRPQGPDQPQVAAGGQRRRLAQGRTDRAGLPGVVDGGEPVEPPSTARCRATTAVPASTAVTVASRPRSARAPAATVTPRRMAGSSPADCVCAPSAAGRRRAASASARARPVTPAFHRAARRPALWVCAPVGSRALARAASSIGSPSRPVRSDRWAPSRQRPSEHRVQLGQRQRLDAGAGTTRSSSIQMSNVSGSTRSSAARRC